ncbi:papilin isoform X5 [Drosophila suzukii]|uniref:Papilin isoform X5 n=1 Tax=Drosophila suzukii TaxID=28584 RepID=A0AB40DDV4_DROSZ
MDLSRRLCSTALVAFIVLAGIHDSHSRFPGLRQKRQYGANMYLPESSVTPGGEGDDPDEWTPWSSPSDCSRTCGGGVSYQTRECLRTDARGEAICSGGSRRYFSCNTQDCPEEEPDFRSQQCSRFDRQHFDGVLYEWVPYLNAPNPCELNCMPKGERFYYRQRETVIDGTRCNDQDLDVCVNGKCMPVGCDMMLGSNAKEDKCRKCGGDGSTCKTIRNTITTKDLAAGYNDLLLLPEGATNIRIEETAPSSNYLACRNHSGHYYLNGDWRIDFPRPMFFANSWWNYQRKPMGFAAPDQLTCSGPISESIFIVMLVQEKNISLEYEYSIPESLSHSQQDTHTWTHHQFGECSASCGGGTQSRVVTCNNRITLAEVNPALCDEKSKPLEEQECGTEPCAPHWVEGEWSKCSKGCGADGFQNRSITCERISSSGEHTVEEDAVCLKEVGNKPATKQECNRDVKNCPKYHLGPWTPCDKLCGEGKQTRKVTCYIKENGRKRVLPEEDCVEEKPEVEKSCLLTPCEGVDWIISQWSGCNACGQNTETRTAICGNKEGKVYPEEFCEPEVPTLSRPCKSPKCQAQWFSSEWSKCSAPCGKGVKSRIVLCGEFNGMTVSPASDDSKCDKETKPESEQECEGEEKECPGEWFTGPWGECSKPCGGGERVREVLCLSNGTKSVNCDESKVEPLSEKCNPEACTEDEILPLTSTDKPIEDDEEDCDEDGIELITDSLPDVEKSADIIDLEDKQSTETTPEAEELMQSDSPTPFDESDSTGTTVEGSGDESDSTTDSGISTEGSGDDEETSEASTDLSSSTTSDSSSSDSSSSDSSSSDSSSSVSSDSTSEAPSSSVSDSSDSTDQSTESTGVSGSSTDVSSSTEASTSDSTDVSSSSDASESTVTADSTSEGSTEASSSTDDSTDSSDKTSDVSESTTEASSSSVSDSSDSTDSSTDSVSSSTESSSDSTSDATSDSTVSSDSTDSTSEETTESTSESSTDTTESSTLDASSTTDVSSTTGVSSTTDASSSSDASSTESSTDGSSSTSSSDSTESTVVSSDGSTDTSTDGTTDGITDKSTDGSTESSTDGSTDGSSDASTDGSTDGSTESSVSTESTEVSGGSSTTEGSTVEDDSSTSSSITSDSTVTDSSSSTDVSGSTETTDTSASTEASSTDSTESTESTSTGETGETTESGPTEESTTEGSTESTSEGSTDSTQSTDLDSTTNDIWSTSDKDDDSETSTPYSFDSEVTKDKPRKCKPKKSSCAKSKYGCCPDGKSTPKGPFDEGCPIAKTCADTTYGCCLDGVSPAKGKNNKGCPKSQCAETLFGCCPDKFTAAEGEDDEGCPQTTTVPPTTTTEESQPESTTEVEGSGEDSTTSEPDTKKSCSYSDFGCCPDGETTAKGEKFEGCDVEPEKPKSCRESENGCCPDGQTPASGPNGAGCAGCTRERYGCCPDSQTPAHGPNKEGCCLDTEFGCCPDNILAARGPNNEGCECHYTPYGCCPDNKSPATGYNQEGCACETTQHGCCPDKITAAKGPKFEGCPCETTQFGCCPDGITFAKGQHNHGCHCLQTEFKCCDDEKTPAKGPNGEGCTCLESKFGCCPDGVTKATDEKFGGCENVQQPPQKACSLPKETGNCTNFSVKYFFDVAYGGCARFWYGGCEGNDNRFDSETECKDTCQEYSGKHVCLLPKASGPCTGSEKKWYFNADYNRCEEFQYGGCYGTSNRFDTKEQCQGNCSASDNLPTCEQPVESGPCAGNFERWYYDNESDICRPFTYGGCKGNKNNYPTEHACNYNCRQPGVLKADGNDLDNGIGQNPCDTFDAECRELRCPYGVRRDAARSQPECTQCVCDNPCDGYSCPEGQQCAIDVSRSDDRQFAPVCREINKPGECPALSANASGCVRECYSDADCLGNNKCCSDGCGQLCVHPARPTQPPRTQAPVVSYPGDVSAALEPKEPHELDVQTSIGGIAVLRCFATGNPAPNITWSLKNLVINTNKGRYVLTSNGDLTIVQVRQTDDGTYVCVASNGLGEPVRREVALQVTEPVSLSAYIYGDKNVTQIVQLNRPAVIRCPAGGFPEPHVSWWRNGHMFGLKNNLMARDYSLVFNSIQLTDLGLYTCEVYNQRRPVSLRVTLKAVGPVRARNHEEAEYLQYVLDPATRPVTQRPVSPYRPTRPAYVPEPIVNVNAVLALDPKNNYSPGSTIFMSCSVQGYPLPNVTWTKDDVPLYNNERVQISSQPHSLILSDVTPEDSGKYTCRASNAYTYANGDANVSIQSVVPVSPECVDNPYFANCKLIVQGKYCTNPYYTKFCCRSCTLAGQVASAPLHPNAV